DVRLPAEYGTQFQQSIRPFCENLILMPVCPPHNFEDLLNITNGNIRVKEVTHAIDKHAAGNVPAKRVFKHVRLQCEVESIPVIFLPHRMQPVGKTFGITVLAARTDLGAAGYRIPGRVGPFDMGTVRHQNTCLFLYLSKMYSTIL